MATRYIGLDHGDENQNGNYVQIGTSTTSATLELAIDDTEWETVLEVTLALEKIIAYLNDKPSQGAAVQTFLD